MGTLGNSIWPRLPRALRRDGCVSWPKSGRTWLRVMLDDLGAGLDYRHGAATDHTGAISREGDLAILSRFRRVLFLYRDPRDTCVSAWHHAVHRSKAWDGPVSEFVRHPRYGVERIARYNLAFLEQASAAEILPLAYETLRRDTAGELGRVLGWLGRPAGAARLAEVADRHSFGRMKAREKEGAYAARYGGKLAPAVGDGEAGLKVRKGKVGGYAEELPPDDVAFADDVLGRLDYFGAIRRAALARYSAPE